MNSPGLIDRVLIGNFWSKDGARLSKREMLEEITGADAKTALVGEEEQKQADGENVAQLAEKGEQE